MVDDYIYLLQNRFYPMKYSATDSELRDMLLTDLEYILSKMEHILLCSIYL